MLQARDGVARDSTPHDGEAAGSAPPVILYLPPSPTGWKSTADRQGPAPLFSTAVRIAGGG